MTFGRKNTVWLERRLFEFMEMVLAAPLEAERLWSRHYFLVLLQAGWPCPWPSQEDRLLRQQPKRRLLHRSVLLGA